MGQDSRSEAVAVAVVEFTRNDPDRNLWMSCSQTEGNTRCTDFQGLKMAFIIDEPLGKDPQGSAFNQKYTLCVEG